LTDPNVYHSFERRGSFVLVPGEEVTMFGDHRQVHVNGLCTKRKIGGHHAETQAEALAWGTEQVLAQGGVALVNHPNWDWALKADDLASAKGAALLEIASGHPRVHQEGDATHLSHEAIWDEALGRGLHFAGVAVDDAHNFADRAPLQPARPGRGWVQVFSEETTREAICAAMKKGRLYASTGAEFDRIRVEPRAFTVWPSDPDNVEVEFIGAGGHVLQKGGADAEEGATYEPEAGDKYVRARLTDANGKHAWTPAFFVSEDADSR
jgi:hypothetical protein